MKTIVFWFYAQNMSCSYYSALYSFPNQKNICNEDMLKRLWERSFKAIKRLFNYKSFRHKCSRFYCHRAHARVFLILVVAVFPTFLQRSLSNFTALASFTLQFILVFICVFCLRFNFSNRQQFLRHEFDVNGRLCLFKRLVSFKNGSSLNVTWCR